MFKSMDCSDSQMSMLVSRLESLRGNRKNSEDYLVLAENLYLLLRSDFSQYLSEDFQILTGGASNIFTAKVSSKGETFFLKATKKRSSFEHHFYNMLVVDDIEEQGKYFSFIKPIEVFENNIITAYLFPFLDLEIIKYNPNNLNKIIMGLAEVTAKNYNTEIMANSSLPKHSFKLSSSAIAELKNNAVFECEEEERDALRRHDAILSNWDLVVKSLKNMKFSLCNRDVRRENISLVQEKIVLFDMGAVALAPPGTDLYQVIHEVSQIFDSGKIFKKYASALSDFGVSVPVEEVILAAYAASAYKWLNVKATDKSTLKTKNYFYALDRAELCVDACKI